MLIKSFFWSSRIGSRDQAVKAAEEYGDKLAVLAKEVATGTGAWAGKVTAICPQ